MAVIAIGITWSGLVAGASEPSSRPATQPTTLPAKELNLDLGNNVTMRLVLIPAGSFTMGSPKSETGRSDNEGPQHQVTISKAFYMGVYEVTQPQYTQVMGRNPSRFKDANNPVECVRWEDVNDFCAKLSHKTGRTVRLPTEAQWEYACRAGSIAKFYFGDDDSALGEYAWYTNNSNQEPHPVGLKRANNFGLYDMHGNVWEWCSDWYTDSYPEGDSADPRGASSGWEHVQRGGSWTNGPPRSCRSARRNWVDPDLRQATVGFRVVVLD
jgi:formylglycine-generating enzyme required for sulfatase activity